MRPDRGTDHLVTDGPFSFTRNPLYAAGTMLVLGIGLVSGIVWFSLLALFAAFTVQKLAIELDKRSGYIEGARKAAYDLISENASHATYRGFHLTTQGGLGKIGPFTDELKLQAWLEEMAKRFGHAAIVLLSDFEGQDHKLDLTRGHYLNVMNEWGTEVLRTVVSEWNHPSAKQLRVARDVGRARSHYGPPIGSVCRKPKKERSCCRQPRNAAAFLGPQSLNLISKLNPQVSLRRTKAALPSSHRSLKLEVIHER